MLARSLWEKSSPGERNSDSGIHSRNMSFRSLLQHVQCIYGVNMNTVFNGNSSLTMFITM